VGTRERKAGRIAWLLFPLVAATVGVAAPPARALSTCTFTGGEVQVTIADPPDAPTIVRSGDAIHVNGVQCDTADVNNTDLITVTDTTSANINLTLDLSGGAFAPGVTDELDGSSEIEIAYSMGASNSDNLTIKGTTGPDHYVIGEGGVNLDADESDGIDTDLTLTGVDGLIVQSNDGNDEISGAGGFGTGAPTLLTMLVTPGDGDDTYTGGDGRDTYFAGGAGDGTDTFVGGDGMDSANYLSRTADLTLTVAAVADDGETGEGDDIRADDIVSGSGNDIIVGDDNANQLFGFNGDDDISGMGGDDTFVQGLPGDGVDTISGGDGVDHVMYVNRNSVQPVTVTLDDVADDGAPGEQDNIGSDNENVTGGQGNDVLSGDEDDNVLLGTGGIDELNGGGGDDTLDGGDGLDTYDGGTGDDLFLLQEAAPNSETVTGGEGSDTADYESTGGNVTITLDGAANDGVAGETDNLLVENATGGNGADSITGDVGPNVLHGGSNNDTLNGDDGNDVLAGDDGSDTENGEGDDDTFDQGADANGADTLNGGDGTDTVDYGDRTIGVVVTLNAVANDGTGEADNVGGAANDIENVIGGSADDDLTGNAATNLLEGGPGADTLNGGDGDDTLDGGTGGDTLNGGDDADTLAGGDGADDENGGAGADTFEQDGVSNGADMISGGTEIDLVDYSLRTTRLVAGPDGASDGEDANGDGAADEGDLIAADVENITGGAAKDRLIGNELANVFLGGAGNDVLIGRAGKDVLKGQKGRRDEAKGGPGKDKCSAEKEVSC
jgi:Ca2+-binding RTX toxin-like protein